MRRARRRWRRARDGQGHLPRRRDRGLHRRRRTVRRLRPAGRPRLHPHLRAASRRDRGRRGVARPAAAAIARAGSRPAEGAAAARARQPTATTRRTDRRAPTTHRRRPTHDPRDRRPDALPGDVRGPARPEHPGADPGAGARLDPDPRPARVGDRPPSVGRRRAVRRGSGDDPAPGTGRGGARRAAPPRFGR